MQPIDSDQLKKAIGVPITDDLGEFNAIKSLPEFSRTAAATLKKAWAAHLDLSELAKTQNAVMRSRIGAIIQLEAQALRRLLLQSGTLQRVRSSAVNGVAALP